MTRALFIEGIVVNHKRVRRLMREYVHISVSLISGTNAFAFKKSGYAKSKGESTKGIPLRSSPIRLSLDRNTGLRRTACPYELCKHYSI
ncbi:hypothetical protein OKW24_000971 [Peribacillus simplex]|nr:hypothetical protein [Peribacillus simplex]